MNPHAVPRPDLDRANPSQNADDPACLPRPPDHTTFQAMQPLKAHVHNGRLVLDEPTDLPEGEVIELLPVDDVLASGRDYLDAEERERLHDSIERGFEDVKASRTVEASKVIERLRARVAGR